ncbi:hypothetical protein FisN_8Lh018 [Fistulifera solaris]|uniref:Uncharacterized protein n=1 Tax=Fistulifera solaris TaxID=1519565 RepID=A0A1Z5JDH1_FISSO|nr:hypothetical protein FisN_8Lh018 [Fistulifera solaris]|eukprot:GAX11932.1 hypothetical protein FisN_8Lh018 [Fistulifera solaris]
MDSSYLTLNNAGVQIFINGDCQTAAKYFQESLVVLKQLAAQLSVASHNRSKFDEDSSLGFTLLEAVAFPEKLSFGNWDGSTFMYSVPFLLQERESFGERELSFYSSIVLFNLALCFHKRGIKGHSKLIQQALNLYRFTLQLLADSDALQSRVALMIEALVLNNKANCHYELCDIAAEHDAAERLVDILMMGVLQPKHGFPKAIIEELIINSSIILDMGRRAAEAA